MTIINCPNGCGGVMDTGKSQWCPSCRRGAHETEVRGEGWCWQWWGPSHHRMRCRLPAGHDGEHDTHEDRILGNVVVATDGELIIGAASGRVVVDGDINT